MAGDLQDQSHQGPPRRPGLHDPGGASAAGHAKEARPRDCPRGRRRDQVSVPTRRFGGGAGRAERELEPPEAQLPARTDVAAKPLELSFLGSKTRTLPASVLQVVEQMERNTACEALSTRPGTSKEFEKLARVAVILFTAKLARPGPIQACE